MNEMNVWTIAGSDTCGGAGIQADLKTFANLGVHGCSIITAVTAQNLHAVEDCFYLSAAQISSQIQALKNDLAPAAVKIGMLGTLDAIDIIHDYLRQYSGFSLLDPLLISSSGRNLFAGNLPDYQQALMKLFSYIDVLTPNIPEAELLLQRTINTTNDIESASREFIAMGVKNVVIKGGHGDRACSDDYWTNGSESYWLSSPRAADVNCHGTGCVFSSALAAAAANGYAVKDAIVIAKMYINRGLRAALKSSSSVFFPHGVGWPEDEIDLPVLEKFPVKKLLSSCKTLASIGLYPVVESVEWLVKLLPLGVSCIQLRIKNKSGVELENELQHGIRLAKQYQTQLFINDYWQLAIRFGADGVHLGQEDLDGADIQAIQDAGLYLGISTHCYHEVARAHGYHPSYIACGPIYSTTSKIMPFKAQGVEALARWRRTLRYPLVAIGGITADNIDEVLAVKVDGVAMISAITRAQDPERAALTYLKKVADHAA